MQSCQLAHLWFYFSTWLDQYANIAVEKASVYSLKIGIPSIHEFLIHNYFYVHLILIPDKEVSHTHSVITGC